MVNNTISQDEFNVFMGISNVTKVKVMELYLIEGYTMNDVGYEVFGKDDRSFTVSLIHRCYNFSGRNGGKYRKGCKFQLEHNYIVSKKDIEEFIKRYPRGTFGNGITFEDFLIDKIRRYGTQSQNNVMNNNSGRLNRGISSDTGVRNNFSQELELDHAVNFDWSQMDQDLFGDRFNSRYGNSSDKSSVTYGSNNSIYSNNRRTNYKEGVQNNRRKRNPNILIVAIIFLLIFITMINSGTIFIYGDYALASFALTVIAFVLWWKS